VRQLVFAEPAERDLNDIIDYIASDIPSAVEKVYRSVVTAARRLIHFPEIGRVGRLPDTRELPLPSLPYLIVYHVNADAVTVLAVFHTARDLVRALSERGNESKQRLG
jgi:toxin ParE1/3/4